MLLCARAAPRKKFWLQNRVDVDGDAIEGDVDKFISSGWEILSNEVGANRKFPMPPIDHDRELNLISSSTA